jgi:hypothetical protein
MWLWYVLLPLIAIGIWRRRERLDARLIVLAVLLLLAADAVLIGSAVRQRSTVEPLLLVMAACGFTSLHRAARVGAVALAVVAIFAAIQTNALKAGATPNTLANSSFESGTAGWKTVGVGQTVSRTRDRAQRESGRWAMAVATAGLVSEEGVMTSPELAVEPARRYTFSAYVDARRGTRLVLWSDVHDQNRAIVSATRHHFTANGRLTRQSMTFSTSAGAATVRLFVLSSDRSLPQADAPLFSIDAVSFSLARPSATRRALITGGAIAAAAVAVFAISRLLAPGKSTRLTRNLKRLGLRTKRFRTARPRPQAP